MCFGLDVCMKMGQIEMEEFFFSQTRRRAVYRYVKKKKVYKETLTTHTHTLLRSEVRIPLLGKEQSFARR